MRCIAWLLFCVFCFVRQQMDKQQLRELEEFVEICKSNPEVLHVPELSFYRDWLQRYVTVTSCQKYLGLF